MITECNVKTTTEVANQKVVISSVYSEQGNDKPTLFRTDLLDEEKTINKVSGKEGELLFTHIDSGEDSPGEIDSDGNLTIKLSDDDAGNYSVNKNGNLIYESDE